MMLLYGIAIAALVWWLVKVFARSDAAALAKGLKAVSGIAALGGAVILGAMGRITMALLLAALGAWVLGWGNLDIRRILRGATAAGEGSRFSRFRSAMIEVEVDHATGLMEGTVLAGAHAGRRLAALDQSLLRQLHEECGAFDPEGVALLEAYFDRRFAGWREYAQGDRDTRTCTHTQSGVMTKEEAYQVLGLQPGAGVDEVRKAYRLLMKKFHPDQGGTAYLAARINQARETLLGRHR